MNKDSGIIIPSVPLVEEQLDLNDAFNMLLMGNQAINNQVSNLASLLYRNNGINGNFIAMLTAICKYTIMRAPKMKDQIIKHFICSALLGSLRAEAIYLQIPDNQKNPDAPKAIQQNMDYFRKKAEKYPGLYDKIMAIHAKLGSHYYENEGFRDFDMLLEMIEMDL